MNKSFAYKLLGASTAVMLIAACAKKQETVTPPPPPPAKIEEPVAPPPPPPPYTGPAKGSLEDLVATAGSDRVFFALDSSEVTEEGKATLATAAKWMAENSTVVLTVEGHCDERGTREYNLALGDRRAVAVRDFLVAQGVAADRVKAISYGKERPSEPGTNEAAWAKNRRGQLVPGA